MTEPQVWTLIGVFGAALFGMLTLMSTMFVRVIRTEVGGLRSEMLGELGGLRSEMRNEIGGLRSEMRNEIGGLSGEVRGEIGGLRGDIVGLRAEMNARFETVDRRFDYLERDVQALTKRAFGE
ncbi:hypothetical protein [Rathayibacter soli]|uniref:hypothetical protein n=1 Tax=Rathayibacter soli TaxID=3144168 RepID=UPI0027E55800|nr:hypothetical protein [Glaciibacter superstes]